MLRQATPRMMISLLCISALILTFTPFTSCYKLDPLSAENIPASPPEPGGVGNDVTTMTQLKSTTDGGWQLTTDFFDKSGTTIGEAKIEAEADLVSFVASKNFNIPGSTRLTFSNNASVTVTVAEESDAKYRVSLTNDTAPAMPAVWFLIDNVGDAGALGKRSTTGSQEQTDAVDPAIFAGYVATHLVLLIGNPGGILDDLVACREEAIAKCGSMDKVDEFYIIITFSLRQGLSIDCYSTCIHDQGRWGYF